MEFNGSVVLIDLILLCSGAAAGMSKVALSGGQLIHVLELLVLQTRNSSACCHSCTERAVMNLNMQQGVSKLCLFI